LFIFSSNFIITFLCALSCNYFFWEFRHIRSVIIEYNTRFSQIIDLKYWPKLTKEGGAKF